MADTSRLGRYEIRREIARSNDIVYEAVDTLIGRRVALKELALPPNLVGTAKRDRIERFYREARAAGALTHRNIVTIFEVGEDHGRHYIAMEYLEGRTLREILDTGGAMPVPEVIDILRQTLDALAYAHTNGVVHRDIKPDNIYILADGSVKLTDFGIARIMDEPSLTSEGQVFGTPSYMSPEQIAGKPVDERTDLYSTGVMAYEMLAGRKPFVGENVVALTYQILSVESEPPRGIPEGLAAFLRRALAKEPSERFQSARQMADALLDGANGGRSSPYPGYSGGLAASGSAPGGMNSAGAGFAAGPTGMASGPGGATAGPSTGAGGAVPGPATIPPGTYARRRFRLTAGMRQFLLAVAAGILLGGIVVAGTVGVQGAYQSYIQNVKENAALAVYNDAAKDYAARRYDDAIRKFTTVTERARGTPMAAEATHAIVQSYLQLGDDAMDRDIDEAAQYYQRAVAADPRSAEAYIRLGDALERLGHFDDAIAAWQKAIDIDGFGKLGMEARRQQAYSWYNRGVSEFQVGHRENAHQYWQNAIDADPTDPIAGQAQEMIRRLFPATDSGF